MHKYKHGFLLGKFMPPHKGHEYLITSALDSCEKLTVLLCSQPDDPIPGESRFKWLKEMFPTIEIVHHPEPLPRDQSNPHFWDLWRESIRKYCPDSFDVVFSSEAYGDRLAQELGSVHVSIDPQRKNFPVSGTDIRSNPRKFWGFIPEIVRPYFKDA